MYKAASIVTRDETSLLEDEANTLACNLAPIYFALDVKHADVDSVLIGPNQLAFMELYNKIAKTLGWPPRIALRMPEIVGMDG
jgi:hypothetical protein